MGTSQSPKAVLKQLLIKHVIGRLVGLVSLCATPLVLLVVVLESVQYGWDMGEEVEDLYDHIERSVHMIVYGGAD